MKRPVLNSCSLVLSQMLVISAAMADVEVPSAEPIAKQGPIRNFGTRSVGSHRFDVPHAGTLDLVNTGIDKWNSRQLSDAQAAFSQAIARDAQNIQATLFRGMVRKEMGDYINAIADFNQIRVAALQPGVLSERGYCFEQLNDFPAAMSDFNRSLALDHDSPDAAITYSRRASLYRITGELNKSLSDCNSALALDAENLDARMQRGLTYLQLKQFSAAAPDFRQVISRTPEVALAHFCLAECLSSLGNKVEALTEYQSAAELYASAGDESGKEQALNKVKSLQAHNL